MHLSLSSGKNKSESNKSDVDLGVEQLLLAESKLATLYHHLERLFEGILGGLLGLLFVQAFPRQTNFLWRSLSDSLRINDRAILDPGRNLAIITFTAFLWLYCDILAISQSFGVLLVIYFLLPISAFPIAACCLAGLVSSIIYHHSITHEDPSWLPPLGLGDDPSSAQRGE